MRKVAILVIDIFIVVLTLALYHADMDNKNTAKNSLPDKQEVKAFTEKL